jgi:hypothetical protein
MEGIRKLLEPAAENSSPKRKAAAPDKTLLEKMLDANKRFKPAIAEYFAKTCSISNRAAGQVQYWSRVGRTCTFSLSLSII